MRSSLALLVLLVGCGSSTSGGEPTRDADTRDTSTSPTDTGESPSDDAGDDTIFPIEEAAVDGARDTSPDTFRPPTPDAGATSIACGNLTCSPRQVCCVLPAKTNSQYACSNGSCANGWSTERCAAPGNCGGSTPYCCVDMKTDPSCGYYVAGASCAASCSFGVHATCPDEGPVRVCNRAADCADLPSNEHNCCQTNNPGAIGFFCTPDAIKGFAVRCVN